MPLPETPHDPLQELTDWSRSHLLHLHQRAALIRTCLSEFAERPDLVTPEMSCPAQAARSLAAYLERLQEHGLTAEPVEPRTAAAMLLGTLFADAIGRDIVPDMYAVPTEEALTQYVALFLRGIGVETSTPRSTSMRSAVSLSMLLLALAAPAAAQQATHASAQPLSIEQALDLAERASESVGLARSGLAQAQGERQRARSGYYPQLTGSASYTRALRSQFSGLQDNGPDGPVPEECSTFVPRPGLPIEERLDSLESALECASNSDPFAGLANDLPFGRENTYRFGLSFSQNLFTGGRVSGQARAAEASVRSARLGLDLGAGSSCCSTSPRPTTTRRSATAWSVIAQAITGAGGHHAEPDTACPAGRQPVRVRSAARPSDARQSAAGGDPAAGGSRHRLLSAQEPPQPAAGSSRSR